MHIFDNLFSLMKFITTSEKSRMIIYAKTSCEIEYDPGLVKWKQKLGDATESINVRVAHGVNRQLQWTNNITYNAIIVILSPSVFLCTIVHIFYSHITNPLAPSHE